MARKIQISADDGIHLSEAIFPAPNAWGTAAHTCTRATDLSPLPLTSTPVEVVWAISASSLSSPLFRKKLVSRHSKIQHIPQWHFMTTEARPHGRLLCAPYLPMPVVIVIYTYNNIYSIIWLCELCMHVRLLGGVMRACHMHMTAKFIFALAANIPKKSYKVTVIRAGSNEHTYTHNKYR